MLAELAAANAAFAVIKAAVNNSGEILSAGQKLFDYFDAKATIQKRYNQAAQSGKVSNDMEEFMALEQLKQQEEHLKQSMIYAGRPGMWEDWVKFQAQAARRRKEAAEAAAIAARKRAESLKLTAAYIFIAVGFSGVILFFTYLVMRP